MPEDTSYLFMDQALKAREAEEALARILDERTIRVQEINELIAEVQAQHSD